MHMSAAPQVKSIRALARGLDVLKALQERPATSLHDLHGDTGLSKPTLLRILRTLEEAGMVHRAIGDGRYRVSARVRFLGRDLSDHDAIAEQAAPALHRLCRRILWPRSEEHTTELQSLMRISYAVFCLKKKTKILTSQPASTV